MTTVNIFIFIMRFIFDTVTSCCSHIFSIMCNNATKFGVKDLRSVSLNTWSCTANSRRRLSHFNVFTSDWNLDILFFFFYKPKIKQRCYRQLQHKTHRLPQALCPGDSQSPVTRSSLCQRFSPGRSQGPRSKNKKKENKQRQSRQEVLEFHFLSKVQHYFSDRVTETDLKRQSE